MWLILHFNGLTLYKRVAYKLCPVQIFLVHIHARNLTVLVGSIVINALIGVTARGIYRILKAVFDPATALLLSYGI